MKVWLLKQKETNDWKSTKATAEAVYALLKRGVSLLTESRPVSITMAGTQVNPYLAEGIQPEPGSGYFKTSWQGGEITPVMGHVTVHNPNPGSPGEPSTGSISNSLTKSPRPIRPLR